MAETPTLWQLRASLFSEKARWALEYKGVEYRTNDLTPGLHGAILRMRGRGRTAPALDLDGRTVRDSVAIVAALEQLRPDPPLYPSDTREREEALALERSFGEIGHEVRRVYLDPILRRPDLAIRVFGTGSGGPARRAARLAVPVTDRLTRRKYGIDPARVEQARARVLAACDRIESSLGPSGYLVGDRFSVADLTAACVLGPLAMPPEYPDPWWTTEPVPDELAGFREEPSAQRAFSWTHDMYRRHRGRRAQSLG